MYENRNPLCDHCSVLMSQKKECGYDELRTSYRRRELKITRCNHPFVALPCFTQTICRKMRSNESSFWSQLGGIRERLRAAYNRWLTEQEHARLLKCIADILRRINVLFELSENDRFSGCNTVNKLFFPENYPAVPVDLLKQDAPPEMVSMYARTLAGYLAMLAFSKKSVNNFIWPTQEKLHKDPYIGSIKALEDYLHIVPTTRIPTCECLITNMDPDVHLGEILTGNRSSHVTKSIFNAYIHQPDGSCFCFISVPKSTTDAKPDICLPLTTPKRFSVSWNREMVIRLKKKYPSMACPIMTIVVCSNDTEFSKFQKRTDKYKEQYSTMHFKVIRLNKSNGLRDLLPNIELIRAEQFVDEYIEQSEREHPFVSEQYGDFASIVSDLMSVEITKIISPDFYKRKTAIMIEQELFSLFDIKAFSRNIGNKMKTIRDYTIKVPDFPEHYLHPMSAQRGNVKTKKWYTRPSEKNHHASGNAAALFVIRLAVIDLLVSNLVHTEQELKKEIGKMRVYINFQCGKKQSEGPKINKSGLERQMRYNNLNDLFIGHLLNHAKKYWLPYEAELAKSSDTTVEKGEGVKIPCDNAHDLPMIELQ